MSQGEQNGLFSNERPRPGGEDLSCEQARRQIERLIEESDLKDIERTLLLAHVRVCPACKAELECYRRVEVRVKETFADLDTAPNFNERLMAALPAPGSPDSPEWARNLRQNSSSSTRMRRSSISGIAEPERRSILRTYWLPISMSAAIGIALLTTWYRTHGHEGDAPPRVTVLMGDAVRVRAAGTETALRQGDPLNPNDTLRSGSAPVTLTLTSADRVIGNLTLAPNSQLCAMNRHSYQVLAGAAYFKVNKDRPKNSPDEYFEVRAGEIATVRVTGTAFIVDLSAQSPASVRAEPAALISVEEGVVEVRTSAMASTTQVTAGNELQVSATRSVTKESDVKARLAKVMLTGATTSQVEVPAGKPAKALPSTGAVLPAKAPPTSAAKPFNWDVKVKNVPLAKKSLAEGIEMLAEVLENPEPLMKLGEQLRRPEISNTTPLSFSVYSGMPLRSVLVWMARDVGWGFEIGTDGKWPHFTTAPREETPGEAGLGAPPEDVRAALETSPAEALNGGTLAEIVDQLSRRCGVTMVVERGPWREQLDLEAKNGSFELSGQTALRKLEAVLGATRLGCAWYDHALYIGAPSHLELLTLAERKVAIAPQLLGQPVNPQWAGDLKELFATQKYPAENVPVAAVHLRLARLYSDAGLAGKPIFTTLMPPDASGLRFRSGIFGEAVVNAALATLGTESAPVPSVAGMLSQPFPPGPVPDMESLIAQARNGLGRVESKVHFPALNQAFVFKNMSLGEALEWSAWVAGFGLKLEGNAVVIDEVSRCYGPPALQVLALSPLNEKRPEMAAEMPKMFARMLPALYPEFFARVEFRSVGGKLAFTGDTRQLQLAQRLRGALERAMDPGAGAAFDPKTWLPPGRLALEANLKAAFQGGSAKLSAGTFAGMLRQSALTPQLRATVLVDPAAMKEHAADAIPELDVTGASVGKVLEQIAARAGMKAVPEGEVIWLRPAR